MNSKLLLCLVVAFNCATSYTQDTTSVDVSNVSKITFLNPGMCYEVRVAKLQSLYGQVFMNTSTTLSYSSSLGSNYTFYFDPAATVQYRYYYNGNIRRYIGKRIEQNSMNYLGAISEFIFSKMPYSSNYTLKNRRMISSLGLAWGFQRNYKNRFSIDLYFGGGYRFAESIYSQGINKSNSELSPIGRLNMGVWLNRRTHNR